MCFTLTGRWQTRLVGLAGPFVLTWFFAVFTDKRDYWLLFEFMLLVGLVLDLGLYGWLIGYQPRWLTLLLAGLEFFVLKWIMEWPYPFEIRLRTRQALEFYVLAWLLIWLTLHIGIPRLWPRWAEDGGEFRLARTRHTQRRYQPLGILIQRRRVLVNAVVCLSLMLLPWLTAWLTTAPHQVFIGVWLNAHGHLYALAEATAVTKGSPVSSFAGLIGWIAQVGWWSPLAVYQISWLMAAMACLLGFQFYFDTVSLAQVAPVALIALFLPAPWLMLVAFATWLLVLLPLPHLPLPQLRRPHELGLLAAVMLGWGLLWLRMPAASLSQGEAQALTWLRQSVPSTTTVAASEQMRPFLVALSGHPVASEAEATLQLSSGSLCERYAEQIRFRHGLVCIFERSQHNEAHR